MFFLLSVMLGVCFGGTLLALSYAPVRDYIQRSPGLIWLAFLGMVGVMCCTACSQNAVRTFPTNYIILGLYTLFTT